ncbi:MAG: nucleoside-diphosphate sugar epimerase/dehydratase [Candidatus Endonucleobacter bathymodioli]|uniref:Nucleoside-diphosphate sugar epimerase/dehydratase n=1 Tax=Candidatus Endonucleibacter bathymodioli TaxID=539814 RepID=A0AA90NSG1_9GAMM|nr:nucleoside-diphosphate sugar epimerase/dehydratase [Candidatus Endonucleobacter bathymodioli]
MRKEILALSRNNKLCISVLFDTVVLIICLWIAFYIRLESIVEPSQILLDHWLSILLAPVCAIPFFIRMGLYLTVMRYMGAQDGVTIFRACFYATGCWTFVVYLFQISDFIPRTVPFLYCLLAIVFMCSSRYFIRLWLLGQNLHDMFPLLPNSKRISNARAGQGRLVAIYGAGEAGVQLLSALDRGREYHPVAFIDDDVNLSGGLLAGRKIYRPDYIPTLVKETGVEIILLAIPSIKLTRRQTIVHDLECFGLPIRSMPSLSDLASGRMKVQDVRDVDIGDILGREEVQPDALLMVKNVVGKTVMITGAGGSIGSELCRQILGIGPDALILLDNAEYNLYSIHQELLGISEMQAYGCQIIPVLGSVNDPKRLVDIMKRYQVSTLYHAAAYKHVPMVEYNVSQGVRNNVLGTLYTAQAAIIAGVEQFVLISTDKAVRPTNIMGATKRLAEMILQALSHAKSLCLYHNELFGDFSTPVNNQTGFTMVRFGNVLGSSGSVIPVFREQIRRGGPVTVTHPDINRFFMTISEAAQLVIQAGGMGEGGDVFVLDMGRPVKIIDLARRMIQLSGLSVREWSNPEGDIEIIFTGLRPGEKLYEELLFDDNVTKTGHARIFRANEKMLTFSELVVELDAILGSLQEHRYEMTIDIFSKVVSGYKPEAMIVDWLYPHSP